MTKRHPKRQRTTLPVRFPLCGFVRPDMPGVTLAYSQDAYGPCAFYMCRIDCSVCDKRLGYIETRKRIDERWTPDQLCAMVKGPADAVSIQHFTGFDDPTWF